MSGFSGFLTPFSLGVFGWILALLTEQPWLLFYSLGYLASLAQGVSHALTGETPTLPRLRNVRDEYAHTTFFPCLVLQSLLENRKTGPPASFRTSWVPQIPGLSYKINAAKGKED